MELLKKSKEALLKPTKQAKRKLIIIMNCVFVLAMPSWLSLEGAHTGQIAPMAELVVFIYIPSFFLNLFSLVYNIKVAYMDFKGQKHFTGLWATMIGSKKALFDLISCHGSMYSIMFMSFVHIMGLGNPHSDSMLTDYALSHLLIVIAVLVTGKRSAIIWSMFVVFSLFFNVYNKGWDYKYHYMTASEVSQYEEGLKNQEPWALERQAEVTKEGIQPASIRRYFNVWLILVAIALSMALYFWDTIIKIIPLVENNLNKAITDSNEMTMKLMREEQANTLFINIGHELKTPLTMTQNFLLAHEQKQGTSREMQIALTYLNQVTRNLINGLDIGRYNKDFKSLFNHDHITDISSLLSLTTDIFEPSATKKGVHIYKTIEPRQHIKADPSAIQRIINNLLENAIKYSRPEDSITVSLLAKEGSVKIIVSDTGIGIAPEHQADIFEQYKRLYDKKNNIDGLGVGLYLVKQIVDELEGNIDVFSAIGTGSTFTITLPTKLNNNADYDVTSVPEPVLQYLDVNQYDISDHIHDPDKPYIMLVEDQMGLLDFMKQELSKEYNIYVAINGAEAIQKLEKGIIVDIIVSDIMMPEVDGIELHKYVSSHSAYSHLPFIFLTAKTDDTSIIKGLSIKAIKYLPKPFKMHILKLQIETILTYNQRQQLNITNNARDWMIESGYKVTPSIAEFKPEPSLEKFDFSTRESQVVRYILQKKSNKEIGELLHITETTVKKHVSNIFKKAEVSSQRELRDKIEGHKG